MYEDRVKKARALFMEGYNCAQSVVLAFADMYGLTEEQALKVSASFGAGMGRMRLTCGTVSGMAILAGMETSAVDPKDVKQKTLNYSVVRQLADAFKEENGSVICGELLNLKPAVRESAMPSSRTKEYYAKRPCPDLVACAARIFADYLARKGQE